MESKKYKVLGLMSGTSLDGLDLAYAEYWFADGNWNFNLLQTQAVAYQPEFKKRLKESISASGIDLMLLHNDFGKWCGKQANAFINENNLEVDFIASHGHTVFHQTDKQLTFQIGSGHELACESGQKVICDFRSLDVALGGQGAPLVPIGDQYLFSGYDFCLNLGGISNVSFQHDNRRVAFDISPVNMLLSELLKGTDLDFDDRGQMASSGSLNPNLLAELNGLSFYEKSFPKSLGYEWFSENVIPKVNRYNGELKDMLHTAIHHIAYQIAEHIIPYTKNGSKLLATGGGAKNTFLIETIQSYLKDRVEVVVPEIQVIDFKEALIFGFMGVLRERREVNCLSSVTGASTDNSGGVIYYPK